MFWIASFIAICALFAAWAVVSDQADARERKLKRIRRRLQQKEQARADE